VDVRGTATGSRELHLFSPFHLVDEVHALLLTGGSAFGLAAAEGVVSLLEEREEGFDTGVARVPLVPGAVIFDLAPGVTRPGPGEGREAAEGATGDPVACGPVGAGTGATVGKILGPERASRGGLGSASGSWKEFTVGVLAVVNALGDVVGEDGDVLAGVRGPDGGFLRTDEIVRGGAGRGEEPMPFPGTNTTLAVVATDAPASRRDLGRLASLASGALARAVSPVATPFDGDILFALSTGGRGRLSSDDLLSLGVTARILLETAIRGAVRPSRDAS
jgi:L-aminopeptidase/D-esterase-like protein